MTKLVIAVTFILAFVSVTEGFEEQTTFSTLYDGGSHGRIEAFAPEKDGTGWAKTYNELLFFKDGKLQRLKGPPIGGHTFEQVFLGDAAHGYYSPRGVSEKNEKLIYRLIDGEARLHCPPLPIDPNGNEIISNTYVAEDGRVLSWNANRIALWQNGAWSMKPVVMTSACGLPIVFEHEGCLVLVCEQQVHVISPGGELSTLQTAWKLPTFRCVRWAGRTAYRISERAKVVESFDLLSGEPLPLPDALKAVPGPLTDLAVGGGQLLIKTESALFVLAPDGTLSCPSATMPGLLDAMSDPYNPTLLPKLTEDLRGGFWFSGSSHGVWHFSTQGLEQWDWRHGLCGGVSNIRCVSGQTLLFLLGNFQGKLIQAQLGPKPPAELAGTRADRWTTYIKRRGTGMWETDGVITFLPAETNTVRRWDGRAFSDQQLPAELAVEHSASVFGDDCGGLYIQTVPPPSEPFGRKAAVTTKGVRFFSRPSQTTFDFQMEEALEWGVREGATEFDYRDLHVLVTPEKQIYWCAPQVSGSVRYFNGTSWKTLRPDKNPVGLAYSPRYGALVRIGGDRFLRYQTGLLEPIESGTDLLMQNGLFRCPFDRAAVMAQPDRYLLVAPQSLPGAGGRSTNWDSFRSALYYVLPNLAAASDANAEGIDKKALLTFQQYQDVRVRYAKSGGYFLGVEYEQPVRVFGNTRVPMGLEESPLFDRQVGNIREDANGNIWFDFRDASKVCCYRTDDLRVTVHAETDAKRRDRLDVRAAIEPPVKNVRYFYRLTEQEAWRPFSTPDAGTLCFPRSGIYSCEVAAVHMGARLKHIGRIRHEALVALPDTRLTGASEDGAVITVQSPDWRPPVMCVPTAPEMRAACVLEWRRADSGEAWQPLGSDGRFPLHRLGTNGLYRLHVAAVEDGFRRDESPVRLTVRLELSDDEQAAGLLENVAGHDVLARDEACSQLKAHRQKWLGALKRLEQQAGDAQHVLQNLDPLRNMLRKQDNQ